MAISDDNEILKQFRDQKSRNYAFNQLVEKYKQQIYFHVRRIVINHDDADDITQNTFIKIFENLQNFREDSKLYTWIYRIATNEALGHLKLQKRRFFIPFFDIDKKLSNSLKESDFFSGDEIQLKLQQAILSLPEKQRLVFNMRYFNEMKYEEMSDVLGTSVGALKASYHLAVKKIEEKINEN